MECLLTPKIPQNPKWVAGTVEKKKKNKSLGPGPAVGGRRRLHGMGQKLVKMLIMTI
jgi:hypothetical protein